MTLEWKNQRRESQDTSYSDYRMIGFAVKNIMRTPRKLVEELREIRAVDVALPARGQNDTAPDSIESSTVVADITSSAWFAASERAESDR